MSCLLRKQIPLLSNVLVCWVFFKCCFLFFFLKKKALIAQNLIFGLFSWAPWYLILSHGIRWRKTEKVHSIKLSYANWQQKKVCRPTVYLCVAQHKLWPGFNMAKDERQVSWVFSCWFFVVSVGILHEKHLQHF